MAIERQTSALPPAQPSYILRGHTAQIHHVQFVCQNTRLLTGDAEGWVVYWKVETKRALAVWKAHDGAILRTAEWGRDNIITHGRDNNLRIWQLRATDEATFSTILPTEQTTEQRPKPWLLHTLPVNTLNFCAFSMCYEHSPKKVQQVDKVPSAKDSELSVVSHESILVAVPARDDKKVEVYQFPDERLKFVVPRAQSSDTGMVMAVKLVHHPTSNNTVVLVGYEGGLTAVFKLPRDNKGSALEIAQLVYLSQPHTQPILSLDASPDGKIYFTSSADAIIAAHRIPDLPPDINTEDCLLGTEKGKRTPLPTNLTPEDQASDVGKVESSQELATTPPSSQPPEEASQSLEFPKESIPSASTDSGLSFEKQSVPSSQKESSKPTGLSSLLSSAIPQPKIKPPPPPPPAATIQPPYKATDTKHAGQQSLHVRSDGRLLVTGGWDSKVRIYSSKTLKEVAVLKWHKEGVYAVGFSEMLEAEDLKMNEEVSRGQEVVRRETGLGKLQRQREEQMQLKHWVVAGAKDGKVSLWEVF